MSQLPAQQLEWLAETLGTSELTIETVGGGKNNRGFRVSCPANQYFVKAYFGADDFNRFQREVTFYRLLNKHQIDGVPFMIATSAEHELAIFEYVAGHLPAAVEQTLIEQVADFFSAINQPDVHASALDIVPARGQLLSSSEFVSDAYQRITRLLAVEPENSLIQSMQLFLQQDVRPLVERLESQLSDAELNDFFRVLSPSDVGFHNTLIAQRLMFFDFEYAGWDSAEKLICDFFAQPRYAMDKALMPSFIARSFPTLNHAELLAHCERLLPITHIKWALIFLNEFCADDAKRRSFSGLAAEHERHLAQQLDKARARLKEVVV